MTARSWVIWIIVLVLVIGGGFGVYWYFSNRSVSADVATTSSLTSTSTTTSESSTSVSTTMTIGEGWNFIAFPYNTVTTVSGLETVLGSTTTLQALYRWTGSDWAEVASGDTLKPGTGYLAYFSESADVQFTNTQDTDLKKVETPVEYDEWLMIGNPLLGNVQFDTSNSTSTTFVPVNGFSVVLADGTVKSMLEAIAQGYISTPLFMENAHPSYSYVKFEDLSGNTVPSFSAFWVKPKSELVKYIYFSTTGEEVDTQVTKTQLESGEQLTSPATQ